MTPEEAYKRRRKWCAYMSSTGRPQLVPADDARAHILKLCEAGMSRNRIAQLSGASGSNVRRIARDEAKWVIRWTHDAILAVTYEEPTHHGGRVSAIGMRRRLGALRADGFPLSLIGDLVGVSLARIHTLSTGDETFVYQHTHQMVADAYDRIGMKPVTDFRDVSAQPQATVRNRARKLGYAPRICWDDDTIDDPDAVPQWTGECGTVNGYRIHQRRRVPTCTACRKAHGEYNREHEERRTRERGE